MKKMGILLTLILAGFQVFGQSLESYGIKTGLSMANQKYDYSISKIEGPDGKLNSVCLGGFAEWKGMSQFTVMTELFYIRKGATDRVFITEANSPVPVDEGHYRYWIHYLSIPFSAKWQRQMQGFNLFALLGPRMDLRLGQDDELKGYIKSSEQMAELYKDYNDLDLGFDMGAGVEMYVSPSFDLIAEYRYSPTLTNVYSSRTLDIRNRSHEVMVGLKF